ncbi:hypothetical protein J6590_008713 [Homalodisca vitripennis]|nr:hypothetical protein J6590_008713 [Homalodisca vitripennis]
MMRPCLSTSIILTAARRDIETRDQAHGLYGIASPVISDLSPARRVILFYRQSGKNPGSTSVRDPLFSCRRILQLRKFTPIIAKLVWIKVLANKTEKPHILSR